VRAHIDAPSDADLGRPDVIEKNERADELFLLRREHANHCKSVDFAVAGGDDHAFDHSALSRSPPLPESVGFSHISESTAAAKNSSVLVCLVSRTQTTYGVDGQRRVDRARALRTSP
jgi:hypothetical protein